MRKEDMQKGRAGEEDAMRKGAWGNVVKKERIRPTGNGLVTGHRRMRYEGEKLGEREGSAQAV